MTSRTAEFIVLGAGLVGLATAVMLQRRVPGAAVLVLEKEQQVAAHQSGHNSGVLHAGVYYEPGSLKARLCREGLQQTLDYCRTQEVACTQTGKLIVATTRREVPRLNELLSRARRNGTGAYLLDEPALGVLEPAVSGLAALLVPETGIVDYPALARALSAEIASRGGEVRLGVTVTGLREREGGVEVNTPGGALSGGRVIVCGGLQADRLLRMSGIEPDFAIIPFRGDYYRLPDSRRTLIRHLIYPVPDPALPFLGIHLTRMIDGGVTVGPSAMLAFAREKYGRRAFNRRDALEAARYTGLWRLLARYPLAGCRELGYALSRRCYLRAVRRYCPSLTLEDLQPHPAGIRAQAVAPDGRLIHDFLLRRTTRMLHVCNAPSPAATAALPIGAEIVRQLLEGWPR